MGFVHINRGENKPSEWITSEKFAKKYPKLAERAGRKIDKSSGGYALKKERLKHGLTLSKLTKLSGLDVMVIQDVEAGIIPISNEFEQKYRMAFRR